MKILVPTSGIEAAGEIAAYVIHTAKKLGATLVAMHILRDDEAEADGERCCDVFCNAAAKAGVEVEKRVVRGEIVETIIEAAEATKSDMIIMGASSGTVVKSWLSADVMNRCETPVLVVPHCYGQ